MRTNVHVLLLVVLLLDGRGASIGEGGEDPSVVAADILGVEEPSTVALGKAGLTHQVTAFIRRVSVPPALFQVRDEWSYRGSDGTTAAGRFAIPPGFTDSSDPVLAVSGGSGDHGG